ncbi:MAG: DNA-binding response regulator [Verrucomicrobia bacterium]|nr:MAG: DNA-binding response regulator [Verrucomicrobiota bacterium]
MPSADGIVNGKAERKRGVLVVDDHPLFLKGVVQLLSDEPDIEVRAQAGSAKEALDALRRHRLDLAVVDISLEGGTNGIELTKAIRAERPRLPVLILSMHDETLYAERALRAGARGYVMKREALDQFIIAVRAVLDGEIFISPVMSNRMVYDHIHGGDYSRSPVDRLSDRELEVLQLIGKGHDIRDIAKGLDLSAKTVETHRAHIKEKLNLANAREVTRFATNWLMLQQQA